MSTPRPLRIACLHGFRQNAQRFRQKTGALRKSLERDIDIVQPGINQSGHKHALAELVYIDAPFLIQKIVPSDSNAESVEPTQEIQERSVFSPNLVAETPPNGSTAKVKVVDVTQRSWWSTAGRLYSGWEQSFDFLRTTFAEKKFDGVLGFSQGAIVASLICALRTREPQSEFASIRFAIMISGFPSRADAHQHLYETPISIPSLHVWGSKDMVIPPRGSKMLLEKFEDHSRKELEHSNGHIVPSDSPSRAVISRFLLDFAPGFEEGNDSPRASL